MSLVRKGKTTEVSKTSVVLGDITTSGQVTFNALPQGQVEVTATVQYVPSGKLAEIGAALFANPEKQLVEDLENFKKYAEGVTTLA